jgi:2-keto-3-deoxy-L-rhamnonate aldolase RhmA
MRSTLKKSLKTGKVNIGSWLTVGHSSIAEIMVEAGFEWLVIDMEHSAITLNEAQSLIQVIGLSGRVPLVRVGENNPYLIKRVMDAGAHGVIVPMVNTKEEAINAVNSVKYPPRGRRGVGLARAQKYGMGFEDYKEWVSSESVVVVQIEHIDAVNNLEEILEVDGVDATIIGPYDLSASVGKPGCFEDNDVRKLLQQYENVSKKFNKPMGYHVIQPDYKLICEKIDAGYTFIAFSLDTLFLGTSCREEMTKLKEETR